MRRVLMIACFVLAASRGGATVIIYRTFGQPELIGDAIIVDSPDQHRVICLNRDGTKRWEQHVADPGGFGRLDDTSILVQEGRSIFRVEIATGRKTRIGRMPAGEGLFVDDRHHMAYSISTNFEKKLFVFRDPVTFAPLWRDDRVESVVEALPDRLFVVTAERHYSDEGFTIGDAALRALDRKTGHELWSVTLNDQQAMSVNLAIVGRRAIVADESYDVHLRVIDIDTGRVEHEADSATIGSKGVFHLQTAGDRVLALETMRDEKGTDRLTTLAVPSLQREDELPLPARENLFFFIDGDVLVTSGIYSVAAFDLSTKSKLWEIDHQLLIARPEGGVLYASYSDRERNRAVLERVDLRSGKETSIYEEPLPPEPPPARESRRAKARAEKRAKQKRREEEKRRIPAGDEICMRYDESGMLDIREYLHLRRDGTAEYIDANVHFPPRRMSGRWRRLSPDVYAISGMPLVRDIKAGRMEVSVGIKPNVELLAELRDRVDVFLQQRPSQQSFSEQELMSIRAIGAGCPEEDPGYCQGDGQHSIGVFAKPVWPQENVKREEVAALIPAITNYLAAGDRDVLRFRIESYRSYRYADWLDPHGIWPVDRDMMQNEIDAALDTHGQPAGFRLSTCTELTAAIAKLGPITEIHDHGAP